MRVFFIEKPPAFACYKNTPHTREATIKYTRCNVQTDGMNPSTGIFTVKVGTGSQQCSVIVS